MDILDLVLLIDDDEHDNFFHTRALEKSGRAKEIHAVESVDEAMDYLKAVPSAPNLIVVDINMPKKSGWDFLREYKELPEVRKAQTVLVMLTSSVSQRDVLNAEKEEALCGFINKPLTAEMVNQIINDHFIQHKV